jgi:hypothetical protein
MMPKLINTLKSFNIDELKDVALNFCRTKFGLCAHIKRVAVNKCEVNINGSNIIPTKTVYISKRESYRHFYCFIKLRMCICKHDV